MDRRFPRLAALLALSLLPLIAACTPDTPETQLSWDANDHVGHRAAPHAVAAAATAGPRVYVYQDGDATAAPPVPTPRPAYHPQAMARDDDSPHAVRQTGTVAFAWPVTGTVISGFGSTATGERNDGINIAARLDTPIRASASGTVSYADSLNGYGNLVLLKHSNGYVTAYAHADRLLVSRGDFVVKGQVIGYTGQTGDVASPQLHFEIRRDTTPVNPVNYLSARAGA